MSRFEQVLRKILRFSTKGPALTRYYLMPHVKLHRIHTSDTDFHSHPWNGFSIIFGSYWEDVEVDGGKMIQLWKRKWFNRISAFRRHKVSLDNNKPVWTLFFHGRSINPQWQYGQVVKPWEGSDQERREHGQY